MQETRQLLAVITPCKTDGKDATTDTVTEYTKFQETIITDLQSVQCVVGRVRRGTKTWGIIDRSTDEARPVFISEVEGSRKEMEKRSNDSSSEDE